MGGLTGLAGKVDPLTGVVNSLLGAAKPPATPAVAAPAIAAPAPAQPEARPTPAAAITTAQPAIAAGARTSRSAAPRARVRGARAASVLTTDLGDSRLGG